MNAKDALAAAAAGLSEKSTAVSSAVSDLYAAHDAVVTASEQVVKEALAKPEPPPAAAVA